jgi:hypothetical protein
MLTRTERIDLTTRMAAEQAEHAARIAADDYHGARDCETVIKQLSDELFADDTARGW